jgi:hypothetical protein
MNLLLGIHKILSQGYYYYYYYYYYLKVQYLVSLNVHLTLTPVQHKIDRGQARAVAYPGIIFVGGSSTNSVEDRGQREQGSKGDSPLVRGSTQFANGRNPYSY